VKAKVLLIACQLDVLWRVWLATPLLPLLHWQRHSPPVGSPAR
jgi:hypothetical protein